MHLFLVALNIILTNIKKMVSSLQVSVGTLLAFTAVAVSVLIIRYIPLKGEILRPFLEGSSSAPARDGYNTDGAAEDAKGPFVLAEHDSQGLLEKKETLHEAVIDKEASLGNNFFQIGSYSMCCFDSAVSMLKIFSFFAVFLCFFYLNCLSIDYAMSSLLGTCIWRGKMGPSVQSFNWGAKESPFLGFFWGGGWGVRSICTIQHQCLHT